MTLLLFDLINLEPSFYGSMNGLGLKILANATTFISVARPI